MAITKVSQYNSSPTVVADYQAQNNYLQALINQSNGLKNILYQATTEIPTIFLGSYIAMGGTLYIVDTENYTILGTALSGDNYISVSVSGSNLIATWVQDISSYSWNNIYNYYSDGTNALLPYVINYDSTYYLMGAFNQFFNQALRTDSDIEVNSILISGDIEVSSGDDVELVGVAYNHDPTETYVSDSITFSGTKISGSASLILTTTVDIGPATTYYIQKNGSTIVSEFSIARGITGGTVLYTYTDSDIQNGDVYTVYTKQVGDSSGFRDLYGTFNLMISEPEDIISTLWIANQS